VIKRWKKSSWKKCENTFFLGKHEYRDKKWGKKAGKNIS